MSSAKQTGTRNTMASKISSVAQTCNQLSFFLKEKSRLKDLITAKFDDTVNSPPVRMTIDLLSNMEDQGQKSTNVSDLTNEVTSARSVAVSEPKTSQMTIFYNGQVVVFDDVSEDRARDVFLAARSNHGPNLVHERIPLPNHVHFQMNGLDLPIARRASLHKFLAKRKERAIARAPYQLHDSSTKEHKFDLNL